MNCTTRDKSPVFCLRRKDRANSPWGSPLTQEDFRTCLENTDQGSGAADQRRTGPSSPSKPIAPFFPGPAGMGRTLERSCRPGISADLRSGLEKI